MRWVARGGGRVVGDPVGGVRAGREAPDEVAGLRGAARLAAALAAERDVGDAALAALRRDAPVLAARRHPRRRLALAARRHAQPRRARARCTAGRRTTSRASWSSPGRASCASRGGWRCSSRARCGRSRRATSRSTCSFTRCTRTRSRTRRRRSSGRRTTQFRYLRRSELSPLMICRLNGKSRAHAQETAEQTLRDMAARGVRGQAIPAVAGAAAARPPAAPGPALAAADPLQRAAAAEDAARVDRDRVQLLQQRGVRRATGARSCGRATRPSWRARRRAGRSASSRGSLGGAAPAPLLADGRRTPRSAYNPAVSADGRYIAFESAEGNLNFAKRYGQMRVYVTDTKTGRTELASLGIDFKRDPHSAYNPSLSADGRVIAYETSESSRGALDVWVTDLRTQRATKIPRPPGVTSDLYEPSLSPDGRYLAFTARRPASSCATSRPGDHAALRRRRVGAGRLARRRAGGVHARRPRRGARRGVRGGARRGAAGGVLVGVGAVAQRRRHARGVHRARRGRERHRRLRPRPARRGRRCWPRAPPARPAPPAFGGSSHPSLSADGTRVAFTSDAYNLSPAKCNPARGIFVRDLATATTTLVSRGDGLNRGHRPDQGLRRRERDADRAACARGQTPSSSSEL